MNAEQDNDDDGSHYRRNSFTQEIEERKKKRLQSAQPTPFLPFSGDNNLH